MGKAFRTSFLLFCFPPYDISSQALVTTSSVKKQPTKPKKTPQTPVHCNLCLEVAWVYSSVGKKDSLAVGLIFLMNPLPSSNHTAEFKRRWVWCLDSGQEHFSTNGATQITAAGETKASPVAWRAADGIRLRRSGLYFQGGERSRGLQRGGLSAGYGCWRAGWSKPWKQTELVK